ncbi:hypothetical protein Syun_018625 [Stephania yunnanensis]|uniref:Uncharacterized protein n=1 Tax=Stephania yunnanensis TaxID=152371 RepID=A0AAP0IU44_9MAGN
MMRWTNENLPRGILLAEEKVSLITEILGVCVGTHLEADRWKLREKKEWRCVTWPVLVDVAAPYWSRWLVLTLWTNRRVTLRSCIVANRLRGSSLLAEICCRLFDPPRNE